MKKYLAVLIIILVSVSCSEYQNILKSTDPELKYTKAVEYFEKNDFMRASTLFDEISKYFRGTERSETILNYLAKSYMGQKDYFTASEYYKTYVKTYPKGKYLVESRFMIGYCSYLDSPDARLDQTATHDAIRSFQEFLDIHPDSERVPEVNKLLEELKSKLAYKELLSARLYYNLGNYLGNNYLSAIVVAQNALKNYPTSEYREELSFIILQSKYQQAFQSIEEKKIERYQNTVDEYYNYINEFPDGKNRREADKIYNESKKVVKD
ncbi:Outer membrane protein assembly factor BamD [bioreactor metagenome]|uniref:Outer membrane protein assembly factor BamD n=1 Tax=bioreactor metagenome TaxID=1076179 RepID=A0A644ZYK6_9ZZZZ|nr:outer membrane protein assembly factor BamD [Paludibacter sp.]